MAGSHRMGDQNDDRELDAGHLAQDGEELDAAPLGDDDPELIPLFDGDSVSAAKDSVGDAKTAGRDTATKVGDDRRAAPDQAPTGLREAVTGSGRVRRGVGHTEEPESENWWRTWLGRTVGLLLGTLALGTAFIWSYLGALHNPTAKDLPVAVVSGDGAAGSLLAASRGPSDNALKAVSYRNIADASDALARRKVYAILSNDNNPAGNGLVLTVATGGSPAAADAIQQVVSTAAGQASLPLVVNDTAPVSAEDPRGLSPFYIVVGWLLAGYLAATAMAIMLGSVPRNMDRLGMRVAAYGIYALIMGFLGALLAGPVLGIWDHHTLGLTMIGALIVFTGAMVASALQSWLGLIGTGVALLLLFILGNPASGGIYPPEMLPGFFRGLHSWLPTGLATNLTKSVAYFARKATFGPVTGLALWCLASLAAVMASTAALGKRARARADS